jgi:hypothetical protein
VAPTAACHCSCRFTAATISNDAVPILFLLPHLPCCYVAYAVPVVADMGLLLRLLLLLQLSMLLLLSAAAVVLLSTELLCQPSWPKFRCPIAHGWSHVLVDHFFQVDRPVRHTITRFSSLLGFMVASLLLLWTALLLALKRSDQHTTRREDAIDREWVCLVHVRIERGANLSRSGPDF